MTTTSTIQDPPLDPYTVFESDKIKFIVADAVSVASSTTLGASSATLAPLKTLHINTKGIGVWKFCNQSTERCITITNPDGSLAYASTRAKLSSRTCTLTDADGKPLLETEYFFGPSKDPVLRTLGDEHEACEIKTSSRWTSRNHRFERPDGRTFEWRYTKEEGFGANKKKKTALVLDVGGKTVAMLIRTDVTRTLGSKACSAGNGGELLLSKDACGKMGVEEEIVVASCLLMLKKEVDRRRCVQLMVVAAVVI